jgi:hypothetical protein
LGRDQVALDESERSPAIRRFQNVTGFRDTTPAQKARIIALAFVLREFPKGEWKRHGLKPPSLERLEEFSIHYLYSGVERLSIKRVLEANRPAGAQPSAEVRRLLLLIRGIGLHLKRNLEWWDERARIRKRPLAG